MREISTKTSRWLLICLVAVTCNLIDTVRSPANAQGTLIWAMPAGASVLDPHVVCGWLGRGVTHQIFESFADQDLSKLHDGAPAPLKPQLAESWDISDDGRVYTFHLRSGVRFHDGTPFDADAVKFNFDRFMDSEALHFYELAQAYFMFAGGAADIESYRIVDPMTFEVTLKARNNEWMRSTLEDCPTLHFVSPSAIEEFGNDAIPLHPVGTGTFKFVEREEGVKIVLERNDDYWGRKAKLDRVIYRRLEDPATRLNALLAGEANLIQEPPWDEIEGLTEEGFVYSENRNPPWLWYLIFNFKNPVMQDVRVRMAINMAIDREGIVREITRNTADPAYGMLSRGTHAHDSQYRGLGYDPEGARALLAEAGYADGLEIDFDIPQYGYGELVEKWIQRDLKKSGHQSEAQQDGVARIPRQVECRNAGGARDERDRLGTADPGLAGSDRTLRPASVGRVQCRLVLQPEGRRVVQAGVAGRRRSRECRAVPAGQRYRDGRRCRVCTHLSLLQPHHGASFGQWVRELDRQLVGSVHGLD